MFNQSDLEVYDRIILPKSLKIPQRSLLYCLEPIGLGTVFTESISSYLTRLAQEHCVTPKKLIMGEIAPLILGNKYTSEMLFKNVSILFGNSDAKPGINCMREMTRSLVDALEQLTLRQDLRYLSCLTWKGVIQERGLFRQQKAWCHQCFEHWQQEKKPIYEPLLWSFKDVGFCQQHNCKLIDRCPHCDSPQKAIANNSRLGFCDRCKGWLSKDSIGHQNLIDVKGDHHELSPINDDSENQILVEIGELVATANILNHPPNLRDLMRKLQLIHFYFEKVVNRDLTQFIALGKIMEQLKITITQHYDKPLNLIKLLIPVCSLAKISISQLFQEDFPALSTILSLNLKIDYYVS